jgi:hypothetical protein
MIVVVMALPAVMSRWWVPNLSHRVLFLPPPSHVHERGHAAAGCTTPIKRYPCTTLRTFWSVSRHTNRKRERRLERSQERWPLVNRQHRPAAQLSFVVLFERRIAALGRVSVACACPCNAMWASISGWIVVAHGLLHDCGREQQGGLATMHGHVVLDVHSSSQAV